MNFLRKVFHRRTTAAWLSNLSVATIVIGLFQKVSSGIQILDNISPWWILLLGIVEFVIANILGKLDAKEDK